MSTLKGISLLHCSRYKD